MQPSNNKLSVKNLISIGIYNAIFFILYIIVGYVMGIVPVVYIFFYGVNAFILGPVFMLIVSHSPKRGTVLISGVIQALIWGLMGGIPLTVAVLVGSLISEIYLSLSGYKKKINLLIAFVIYMLGFYAGNFAPIFLFEDWYYQYSMDLGGEVGFINALIDLIHSPLGYIAAIVSLVGIVLGGLFGLKLLRKHFEKAGLV